jgi:hypothetical protein
MVPGVVDSNSSITVCATSGVAFSVMGVSGFSKRQVGMAQEGFRLGDALR